MMKFRFDWRIRSMKPTPLTRPLSIGSLSKYVFDTRTATGSELFSSLTCLDTTAFTSPSIFSPFEDIRNASIYLPTVIFMFKFDINSGYHQIDILDDHQTFLAFSWVVNGVRKFIVFTVLPFGLC